MVKGQSRSGIAGSTGSGPQAGRRLESGWGIALDTGTRDLKNPGPLLNSEPARFGAGETVSFGKAEGARGTIPDVGLRALNAE